MPKLIVKINFQKLAKELAHITLDRQFGVYVKDIEGAMDGDETEDLSKFFLIELDMLNGNLTLKEYQAKIKQLKNKTGR